MQNEINKTYSAEQLQTLDTLIDGLEQFTADFEPARNKDKSEYVKAPDGSGDWMQNMLTRSEQNIDKLPRSYDPELVKRDLQLSADLESRILRVERILERLVAGQFMARSDAFSALLGVRRTLKHAGVAGVDDNLSDGLKRFFTRISKSDDIPDAAE